MYEEEGELHKDIPAHILQNNLYGIDIDRRSVIAVSFVADDRRQRRSVQESDYSG